MTRQAYPGHVGIIILSEVTQKEKDKWHHLHVESKATLMNMLIKQKQTHDIEIRLVVAEGERSGWELDWESGISRCKVL